MNSVAARAKLNLYLHITGRRADGYHLLESLIVFAELADQLKVEAADTLTLEVKGEFAEEAGTREENLVLRAAELLQRVTGVTYGAKLTLQKHIPVGGGLGGGGDGGGDGGGGRGGSNGGGGRGNGGEGAVSAVKDRVLFGGDRGDGKSGGFGGGPGGEFVWGSALEGVRHVACIHLAC